MDENLSFGYWLRRRRKALDLTQADVARLVGCALSTVRKWEADERRPSKAIAERIAQVLLAPEDDHATFLKAARAELWTDRLGSPVDDLPAMTDDPSLGHEPTPAPIAQPAADYHPGTITMLFTDIEGNSAHWERHPTAMRGALVRHDALVEECIARRGGHLVRARGEGDSHFAVFQRATDAVVAAVELQQALHDEPWPATTPLSVRIAVHTGEVEPRGGDYYGAAVNRGSRLRALARGGQTLLSGATYNLVRDHLAHALPDTELRDLGMRHLRGLTHPEQIFELVPAGLPATYPPLDDVDAGAAVDWSNLPSQSTPLIGRENEIAAVAALLRQPDARLITLTGPGGIGKTRLALQVAAEQRKWFAGQIFFVDLAPISDPTLVEAVIAQRIGLREVAGQRVVDALREHTRARQTLLVLDNFEQVLAARRSVAELLASVPMLKVLITSRTALHLAGEHVYQVPPLALPDPAQPPEPRTLASYPAVQLFLQRVHAAWPQYQLHASSAQTVVDICARLDGLPLAIELAAARCQLLGAEGTLARLSSSLTLLTSGARDLPERQRTLSTTISWSYDLLGQDEQRLFRRLAVFVGGCTLAAIDTVCNLEASSEVDVLDQVQSLLDQSLLLQAETATDGRRFTMLQTIRDYALERLTASGEAEMIRREHAAYFLLLAEMAEPEFHGARSEQLLNTLDHEHDNLRAALRWALQRGEGDLAAHFAVALWEFWYARSFIGEGRRWLTAVLASSEGTAGPLRAKLFYAAGVMAAEQGDLGSAQQRFEEALALRRELGDARDIASSLMALGNMAQLRGDYDQATTFYEESLGLFREVPYWPGIAAGLNNLGLIATLQRKYPRALLLHEESLALARELGDKHAVARGLSNLGQVCCEQGNYARAETLLTQSLALRLELGSAMGITEDLEALARVAAADSATTPRAARLWGAAEAMRIALAVPLTPIDRAAHDGHVADARRRCDQMAWAAAWAAGAAMLPEQAARYALGADSTPELRAD